MRKILIWTLDYLTGVLNLLRPWKLGPETVPPAALLPAERIPGVGMLARFAAIVRDPTTLAVRCLARYRRPFTLRIPFFFDLTYIPGREGLRYVLDMDPKVGRMGPVMKRVPTVGYWFPKASDSEAHLQDLLLAARAFLASHAFRAERLARVESVTKETIARHVADWRGRTVDLADVVVRALYDASLRCVLGEALWERVAPEVCEPLRVVANGVDIPRTTRSVLPGAKLMPEYRATRRLVKVLRRVVAEHDHGGGFEFLDAVRSIEVEGHRIREADVPWMLMYIMWNAVTYPGTYGLWSYLDMVADPDSLAALRSRSDDRPLEYAFMETLRRNPVASLVRQVSEDVQFESGGKTYRVPAGGHVGTCIWALNYDPQVYSDPAAYRPERYAWGEPLPHAFGRGAFGCPAGKFTRLFMRAAHAVLVDSIDVVLHSSIPRRRSRVHLVYPDRPIRAEVRGRRAPERSRTELRALPAVDQGGVPERVREAAAAGCPFHRRSA